MKDEITTVRVRKATRDRLMNIGLKGESYDQIINRIIDTIEPAYEKYKNELLNYENARQDTML